MSKDGSGSGLVLIHGSELGAWIWAGVIDRLAHPALAVDLLGRESGRGSRRALTLNDAISSVVADTRSWAAADRIVLVVHSFAGVLAPAVTAQLGERVAAVVWLSATVPEHGKSWVDLQPGPQRAILRVLYRIRPDGALSPRADNLKRLANDLDPATATDFIDRRVPEAPRFLLDRVPVAALPPGVPSHVVDLLQDRAVSHELRERWVKRLDTVHRHDLDAGHLPMLGKPAELAQLLDRIADEYDPRAPA